MANGLCLACGLCCNGVIFADVKLQEGDRLERFLTLGVKPDGRRFMQPCPALEGCRCRIYSDRPRYCREFECLVFKTVKAGRLATGTVLDIIRAAQKRSQKVRDLLCALGETDEPTALGARFRRTVRRLENAKLDDATADLYGELTLAVHDLNLLLSQAFYPGH